MSNPPLTDDRAVEAAIAYAACGNNATEAARTLGLARGTFQNRLRKAAERGLLGPKETLPGYVIKSLTETPSGTYTRQVKEHGPEFKHTDGLAVKGKTTLVDAEGRIITQHIMERAGARDQGEAMRAVAAGLMDDLPRAEPVLPPVYTNGDLLAFYAVSDMHMGALAWHEETGGEDYDLAIAERLIEDWFAAAIELAPRAQTAILAQMGDLLHWDGFDSVTPTSKHVLDGDSRFPKMVRAAIRVLRRVVRRLLERHEFVHIIMADANHDPASEVWLREMFAAFYDDEPRVTVDQSSSTYYAYQHGEVSLFVHHGHRRKVKDVDSVFAGRFREMYGSTRFSYAHLGHLHSDELKSTNLMKVERHETLAAPDAYAANGGWLSGRSAKVITYHKTHGEVSRLTLTPGMVSGSSRLPVAANDNEPMRRVA
jgi:hypothetical protein